MKFLDQLLNKKKKSPIEEGNPALVRAMHQIALNDTPENRKILYEAMLGSFLILPVPEIPKNLAPGLQSLQTNVQIQLTGFLDKKQQKVTPAFTDVEALRNWDPNTPYLGLKAQEFFRFVMGTDIQEIVINPFDPIRKMVRPGGRVSRWEADLLSKGCIPTRPVVQGAEFQINAGQVMIGSPAQRLSATVEEWLRTQVQSSPEIDALYVFQMAVPHGDQWSSHTVIGIKLAAPPSQNLASAIARRLGEGIRPQLSSGQALDFMVLTAELAQKVRTAGILIFERPNSQ